MDITLKEVSVGELTAGYCDDGEQGVRGYAGKLDIRPPYQREFVYNDAQREAVIDTVTNGYPLNVMYWADREDGTFEVIDGQQRTLSLCQYVDGVFAHNMRYFHNLTKDEQEQILDYKVMVYVCKGTDSEKLAWFRIINIAGEELTDQELLNAVYSGPFVTDAKRHFSKQGCPAYKIASDYLSGSVVRQDYLATALAWISNGFGEGYLATHQHDPNANALWLHFQNVVNWVRATFPKYRKEMKGVAWGNLWRRHHERQLDVAALEQEVKRLMADSDVQKKKGIYAYVLDGDERHLNLRAFDDNTKREVYERQEGICPHCKKHFPIEEMEADHITPWSQGGRTIAENCQMLCRACNRRKSDK